MKPTPTTTPTISHECEKCQRVFGSAPALRMHKIRKHQGRNWDSSKNFGKQDKRHNKAGVLYPSSTKAYRQRKYRERVAVLHAQGLNAHGEPFKKATKASIAMKASWARRKAEKNGAALPAQSDPIGEAARAIMIAAKVLRGTMHSLKLPLIMLAALWFVGCAGGGGNWAMPLAAGLAQGASQGSNNWFNTYGQMMNNYQNQLNQNAAQQMQNLQRYTQPPTPIYIVPRPMGSGF